MSILNVNCVNDVAPCLELSIRAPLAWRAEENMPPNDGVTATLEEGSLPRLARLQIDMDFWVTAVDGAALVALTGWLLQACGRRFRYLSFSPSTLVEAPYFKALIVMLSEMVSSAPWRGTLNTLMLPLAVGQDSDRTKN